jgi:hypothetical protein
MLSIQYATSGGTPGGPHAFSFNVRSALGEEIYQSPILLASVTTQTITVNLPNNTDFGTYDGNTNVIGFRHAVGSTLEWAINLVTAYKDPISTAFT